MIGIVRRCTIWTFVTLLHITSSKMMNDSINCGSNSSCATRPIEQFAAFTKVQTTLSMELSHSGANATTDLSLDAFLIQNASPSDNPITAVFNTSVTTNGFWNMTENITEAMFTLAAVTFEERIIETIFTAFISIVGIPANFLLFLTLAYNKRFRKPLHIMLCSISVFDFCTVCVSPLYSYSLMKNKWDLGKVLCDTIALIQASCISLTLMTHALVAVNCYLKSKFRSNLAHILSSSRAVIISLLVNVVLVGLVVVLPHLTGYVHADFAPMLGLCVSAWTADIVQNIETQIYIHFTICSIVPYVICIFAYSRVLVIIGKRQNIFENEIMKRQFVKACKRMGVLFIAFTICYLPFTIYTLADPYLSTIPTWAIRILLIIFHSHVVVNPLICLISMSDINEGLRHLLTGATRMKSISSLSSSQWQASKQQKGIPTTATKVTYSSSSVASENVTGAEPYVNSWM